MLTLFFGFCNSLCYVLGFCFVKHSFSSIFFSLFLFYRDSTNLFHSFANSFQVHFVFFFLVQSSFFSLCISIRILANPCRNFIYLFLSVWRLDAHVDFFCFFSFLSISYCAFIEFVKWCLPFYYKKYTFSIALHHRVLPPVRFFLRRKMVEKGWYSKFGGFIFSFVQWWKWIRVLVCVCLFSLLHLVCFSSVLALMLVIVHFPTLEKIETTGRKQRLEQEQ